MNCGTSRSSHSAVNEVPTPLTTNPLAGGLVTSSMKLVTMPGRPPR